MVLLPMPVCQPAEVQFYGTQADEAYLRQLGVSKIGFSQAMGELLVPAVDAAAYPDRSQMQPPLIPAHE